MKNRKFPAGAGAAGIALICAVLVTFVCTTCSMAGSRPNIVDAATPVFTDEPSSVSTEPNVKVTLIATAAAPDAPDGEITSYRWFSLDAEYDTFEGTPVLKEDGEPEDWDSIEVVKSQEGIYLYYVVVTNTNNSVNGNTTATLTSNIIVVTVEAASSQVKYPVIKQQPANDTKQVGEVELVIVAENAAGDQGTLRYQWYGVEGTGNKGGARVDGATSATSAIPLNAPGTYNFYCEVSSVKDTGETEVNTEGDTVPVLITKSIKSQTATITVIAELVPNATIVVNPNRKYQYVRGFGGMGDNTFSEYPIMQSLSEYETLFNPDTGLGLNMLRIMIMPTNPEDNTDVKKTNAYYAKGEGNRPLYYEGVKVVNKYGGYVLASPWTPPPEWKSNNSVNGGGHLLKSNWNLYAQYLRDYCEDMYENDAPIYAVSIQNEPNFMATYDGCEWEPEDMRDFFKEVGHFTSTSGGKYSKAIPGYGGGKEIPHVLTMNGESANNTEINNAAMDDPVSRANIDVLGRHTYGDALLRYGRALDQEPKREVWMTEHNINSGNPTAYPNDSTWNYVWLFLNDLDVSIRQNDESAFIWWYIRRFYSAIGDGSYGTVAGVVYPRGYALSHYAKYAKETWRIATNVTGTTANGSALNSGNLNPSTLNRTSTHVRVTAFVSDDGNTISLVMYTPTDTSGGKGVDMGTVKIQLPAGFIASKADAMRSTAAAKAKKETVLLSNDKNSALVMLPPSTILSVRFTK